jgi:hypothetical protein
MAPGLTISVIVCAHNEARYLPACLHSVLAQSHAVGVRIPVWELLPYEPDEPNATARDARTFRRALEPKEP